MATDPSILEWIYNSVKKQIPSCATRDVIYNLTGETVGFRLHKLRGKDREVAYWLSQLLCEKGFEPFAASSAANERFYSEFIHYRQMIEE